jgi:hypothetical protein
MDQATYDINPRRVESRMGVLASLASQRAKFSESERGRESCHVRTGSRDRQFGEFAARQQIEGLQIGAGEF